MSTTWATFISDIRAFLKDEGDVQKYSDHLIYVYTCDAVRDYSNWFPRVLRVEIQADTDGLFPLPDKLLHIKSVEYPEGTFLKPRIARPGYAFRTMTRPTHFWQVGGSIKLNAEVDGSIYLTYDAMHEYPASSTDYSFVFTIPDFDMELLHLYVRAQCLEHTRSRQSNLDRFKRTGRRDDNPLDLEVRSLMDEYYAKISERSRGGVIYLYRK